jgi:hypothetical protein
MLGHLRGRCDLPGCKGQQHLIWAASDVHPLDQLLMEAFEVTVHTGHRLSPTEDKQPEGQCVSESPVVWVTARITAVCMESLEPVQLAVCALVHPAHHSSTAKDLVCLHSQQVPQFPIVRPGPFEESRYHFRGTPGIIIYTSSAEICKTPQTDTNCCSPVVCKLQQPKGCSCRARPLKQVDMSL